MRQVLNEKGILRCVRYAYMPNRLNFCGPDKNQELSYYSQTNQIDAGLGLILKEFQTLYPYLNFIARVNDIRDPFDERVVEAYWIGNDLLERIDRSQLYTHLIEEHHLKKKLNRFLFKKVIEKIPLGAKPHHNFHVLNVWKRTKYFDEMYTLNSMDLCRISWGRIKKIEEPYLIVEYQPLVFEKNRLELGNWTPQKVLFEINGSGFVKKPKQGDWISFHWNFACEVLNLKQVKNLKKYTQESIRLVNERK